MGHKRIKLWKKMQKFYNVFILSSYCHKDTELFKKMFKEYFEGYEKDDERRLQIHKEKLTNKKEVDL